MVPAPDHPDSNRIFDIASKARQAVAQLDKDNVSVSQETDHSVPSQPHPSEK
jgi:hypothetical protein